MSVLKDLYDGQFSVGVPKSLEYRAVRHKNIEEFWDEVEKALGNDVVEEKWKNLSIQEEMESYHYFRQGFRLGAALMLELL